MHTVLGSAPHSDFSSDGRESKRHTGLPSVSTTKSAPSNVVHGTKFSVFVIEDFNFHFPLTNYF